MNGFGDHEDRPQIPTHDRGVKSESNDSWKTKDFPEFNPTGQEPKVIAKYWMECDLTERLRASDSDEILGSAVQEYARRRLDEISILLSGNLVQHLATEIQMENQEMYGEEFWDTLDRGINDHIRTLRMVRRRIQKRSNKRAAVARERGATRVKVSTP